MVLLLMKRLSLLIVVALSVAVSCSAQNRQANVLFIAVDDLRPWVNYCGAIWMKTPNMDRLAASSRVFNRHYVQVATCGAG